MGVIGRKHCINCNKSIAAIEVFKISMGNTEQNCDSCGQPFTFSKTRKWIAIGFLILIVFYPTPEFLLESGQLLNQNIVLVAQYIVAGFIFYLINGIE